MKVNRRILIPCGKTVVESIDDRGNEGIIVKGKLITCGVPTRNGISYTRDSMARYVNRFNKSNMTLPFLDSHDDTSIRKNPPFGHITNLFMRGEEVFYEANVDPEEKQFLHKLKRGDVSEVSLQAIVDAADEVVEDNGDQTIIAEVRELLEVSSVLIPGARDTTAEIQEKWMTEERFVETFRNARRNNITFTESLRRIEAKDDNELMGGPIKPGKDEEEELNTGNGAALIGKKIADLKKNAERLKVITRRL